MEWISSDGGPLIVIEENYLPIWRGASDSLDGGLADYERVGEITDWLGFINVGAGTVLVLSGDDTATTWLESFTGSQSMLLRWIYANTEDEIINTAQSLFEKVKAETNSVSWAIKCDLVLLAACEAGEDEMYPRLRIKIPSGNYKISTIEYEDEQTSVICHCFRKTN